MLNNDHFRVSRVIAVFVWIQQHKQLAVWTDAVTNVTRPRFLQPKWLVASPCIELAEDRSAASRSQPDIEPARALFRRWAFVSLVANLPVARMKPRHEADGSITVILNAALNCSHHVTVRQRPAPPRVDHLHVFSSTAGNQLMNTDRSTLTLLTLDPIY